MTTSLHRGSSGGNQRASRGETSSRSRESRKHTILFWFAKYPRWDISASASAAQSRSACHCSHFKKLTHDGHEKFKHFPGHAFHETRDACSGPRARALARPKFFGTARDAADLRERSWNRLPPEIFVTVPGDQQVLTCIMNRKIATTPGHVSSTVHQ
jgi:hypothetical protein